MIVVADTSGLFAALSADQPDHQPSRRVMVDSRLAISPLVFTELDYLIRNRFDFRTAMHVAEALNDRVARGVDQLVPIESRDLVAAHEVRRTYSGLEIDLCDAVGVVIADKLRTNEIFTLDHRDFRAITPLTKGFDSFRLLPTDTE